MTPRSRRPKQASMWHSHGSVIPNVQLDVGANFGLNSATPAVQVYTGLSQRF